MEGVEDVDHGGAEYRSGSRSDTGEISPRRSRGVIDERWFSRPYRITMIGRQPNRIDVLTSISGVSFREAWKHRIETTSKAGRKR
jgi:hypothetical protein